MALDLSSLEKALNSLEKAIVRSLKDRSDDEVRDSVIQRFEYSYELCWKMLKRRLQIDSASPHLIDSIAYKDLIREGAQKGFLSDVEKWFDFREARNITSHTYEEGSALEVYEQALIFLPLAKYLLSQLKKGNL